MDKNDNITPQNTPENGTNTLKNNGNKHNTHTHATDRHTQYMSRQRFKWIFTS